MEKRNSGLDETRAAGDLVETSAVQDLVELATEWFSARNDPGPGGSARRLAGLVGEGTLLNLAQEPLTGRMICEVFDADRTAPLPKSRVGLYDRYLALRLAGRPARTLGDLQDLAYELRRGTSTHRHDVRGFLMDRLEPDRAPRHDGASPDGGATPTPTPTPNPYGNGNGNVDGIVDGLLRGSGLFARVGTGHVFADLRLERFLAAQRIIRRSRTGTGFGRLLPPAYHLHRNLGRHLHRRSVWPWPDLLVHLFVAELWLDEGMDLSRRLAVLLRDPYRLENLGFVAELVADGARVSPDIRAALVRELDRLVRCESLPASEWDRLAATLLRVDRGLGLDVLEKLAASASGPLRQQHAVNLLEHQDVARAERALRSRAIDPRNDPGARLTAAHGVVDAWPPDRAVSVFAKLANDPSMQGRRVDAALDAARCDAPTGLGLLARLAGADGLGGKSRYRAAAAVLKRDVRRGTEAMAQVSRAAAEDVPAPIRLKAAVRASEHDQTLGHDVFLQLAEDTEVTDGAVRIEAARRIRPAEVAGCLDRLATPRSGLSPDDAISAARELLAVDRTAGLAALQRIACSSPFTYGSWLALGGRHRITAGRTAAAYDHGDLLDRLAGGEAGFAPADRRDAAMALKAVAPARAAEHLAALARTWTWTTCTAEQRMELASTAARLDRDKGREALLAIADQISLPPDLRLSAALAVRKVDPAAADQALLRLTRRFGQTSRTMPAGLTGLAGMTGWAGVPGAAEVAGLTGLTGRHRLTAARAIDPMAWSKRREALKNIATDDAEDDYVRLEAIADYAEYALHTAVDLCGALIKKHPRDQIFRRRAVETLCRLDPRRGEIERRALDGDLFVHHYQRSGAGPGSRLRPYDGRGRW